MSRLWTDPLWLAEAHAWIDAQLEQVGAAATGPVEQPHVRPWSTVMRVPTDRGDAWFKANIPVLAHEAALVGVLAELRPDCVPPLWAADRDRGWMLMGDGGLRLRELIERQRDLGYWLEILPRYGQLQIDAAPKTDTLAALGVPDRRLALLAGQYEQLLDEVVSLSADELKRLRAGVPRVRELCEALAAFALPETIQHDDLHDGQIFVGEAEHRRYLFFDWGDACVSHPFFSMSVPLEGQLAWGLDDIEGSVDVAPFRDAYLEPFTVYASRRDLEAAHASALRLGWLCRALNVQRYSSALESPDRERQLEGVAIRLRLFDRDSP